MSLISRHTNSMDSLTLFSALQDVEQSSEGSVAALQKALDLLTEHLAASAASLSRSDTPEPLLAGPEQATFLSDAAREWFQQAVVKSDGTTVTLKPAPYAPQRLLLTSAITHGNTVHGFLQLLFPAGLTAKEQLNLLKVTKVFTRFLGSSAHWRTVQVAGNELQSGQATARLHHSLNLRQTTYTIANEGRRLLAADRVSVLLRRGKSYRMETISGQASFDRRSKTVSLLTQLANRTLVQGEAFHYPYSHEVAPQLEQIIDLYVDQSHVQTLLIVPIYNRAPSSLDQPDHHSVDHQKGRSREPIGALVVEAFHPMDSADLLDKTQRYADLAGVALANALEHHSVFLLPVWKKIGSLLTRQNLPKTALATAASLAVIASLFLVKTEVKIRAQGTLLPAVRQNIFARSDGIVKNIHVKHGEQVAVGDLLLTIENAEIERRLDELLGQIQTTDQRLADIRAVRLSRKRAGGDDPGADDRLAAEQQQLLLQRESLQRQRDLLQEQEDHLLVRSPRSGEIISWDLEQRLAGRPIVRGQELLTVADTQGDWELDLKVPDRDAGPILSAQAKEPAPLPVTYVLGTAPNQRQQGTVSEIGKTSQVDEEAGNALTLRVAVNPQEISRLHQGALRAGAEVQAKVLCEAAPLGYAWFRDILGFIHSRILFRYF